MNCILCNMCMIEDAATGRVLVLASDQRPAAGRANSVPGNVGMWKLPMETSLRIDYVCTTSGIHGMDAER